MLTRIAPALLIILGATVATPAAAQDQEFKVIVHSSNPVSTMARDAVERVFMKKTSQWADGRDVTPVDLPANSPVRRAFSTVVHRRRAAAVQAHWQTQIFSGRGLPPLQLTTEEDVIRFVAGNPGAIGYVSADADLGTGCHVLTVEPN